MAAAAADSFPPQDAVRNSNFVVHSTTPINAPAPLVWDLLLDPSTWPAWNTFVPKCEGADGKIKQGDRLRVDVSLPPAPKKANGKRTPSTSNLVVDAVEERPAAGGAAKTYFVQWSTLGWPAWLLRCSRRLFVEAKGETACEFRNYETFDGVLAHLLKLMGIREQVEAGFEEWGEGLKRASEGKFNNSNDDANK